ncbi:hypothetical protein RI367_002734 [Sorochytrium milnesiophthora]
MALLSRVAARVHAFKPSTVASRLSSNARAARLYHGYVERRPTSSLDRWLGRHPDLPLYAIIGANVAVFGAWQYAKEDYRQFRNPAWFIWMRQNFMINFDNVRNRPWTAVTGSFSHSSTSHLLVNMIVLYSFGSAVIATIGPKRFTGLYLASALGTAAGSLAYRQFTTPTHPRRMFGGAGDWQGSLGASGCVTAISALFACLYPQATIYVMFVLPMPAWAAIGAFIGYDVYRAATNTGGSTDVSGHLGGGATGLAYFWLMRRGGLNQVLKRLRR